jgi:hypothetical protein
METANDLKAFIQDISSIFIYVTVVSTHTSPFIPPSPVRDGRQVAGKGGKYPEIGRAFTKALQKLAWQVCNPVLCHLMLL